MCDLLFVLKEFMKTSSAIPLTWLILTCFLHHLTLAKYTNRKKQKVKKKCPNSNKDWETEKVILSIQQPFYAVNFSLLQKSCDLKV